MTDGAVRLIGTIVEVEDHYGICEVEIDSERSPGGGRIWLPIPDVVDDPGEILGYEGRRVVLTVAMKRRDGGVGDA